MSQPTGGRRAVKKPAAFAEYDAEAFNVALGDRALGWVTSSPERRTGLGGSVPQLPGGGGIFKSAAAEVLRRERRLMTTGEITKIAIERGFLKAQGKTPEATMASALYTDVKKKNNTSIFTRPQEGLFGLREWIAENFYPDGYFAGGAAQMGFDDEGVAGASNATYRRRTNTPPVRQVRELPGRNSKHKARQTWQAEASDDNHSDWAAYNAASHRATREGSPSGSSSGAPSNHADPLHVLGDACMTHDRHIKTEQVDASNGVNGGGGVIGRKRPLPLSMDAPETQQQQRQLPLPSPGDPLLTLHEVATSPQPYAPKSFINADLTIQNSNSKQRKKLSVAIPHDDAADAAARAGPLHAALDTAGRLFEGQGLPELIGGAPDSSTVAAAAAAAMLLQSPLGQMFSMMAARTSKGAITPWPYAHHNFLSPHGAYLSEPLATPSTFAAAGLDSITNHDLLGHLAHNLGLGAGLGGLTGLTPRGHTVLGAQGRRSLSQLLGALGGSIGAGTGAAGAVGGSNTGAGVLKVEPSPRLMGPSRTQQMDAHSRPDASQGAIRSARRPPSASRRTVGEGGRVASQHLIFNGTEMPNLLAGLQFSATKGFSDLAQLENWQNTIEQAEAQWGGNHPAVGRAWLELARALQAAAKDSERARHATKKAWTICQELVGAAQQLPTSMEVEQSFEYLLQRWDGFHRASPIGMPPMFKAAPAAERA